MFLAAEAALLLQDSRLHRTKTPFQLLLRTYETPKKAIKSNNWIKNTITNAVDFVANSGRQA
jgi:hypothetical protein